MSDLHSILEEHRELLLERGYSEIGLGTDEEPGIFMRWLELSFSQHLKEILDTRDNAFYVSAVGFFNNEQHIVNFNFHYQFDAANRKFELKSLSAEMQGLQKNFSFKHNMYELPYANQVVSTLLKEKEKKEAAPVLKDLDKIASYEKNLEIHQDLLEAKGYIDKKAFPYRTNYLLEKLKDNLASIYREKNLNDNHSFYLSTQGYFNNENDEVSFYLSYNFDGEEKALRLSALVAELDGKKILYPVKESKDLPHPSNVWKCLTNKSRQSQAIVIYPKDKLKILLREQERFLGAFGYYDTCFSNNSLFIERELQSKLEKHLHERDVRKIPIERTIYVDQRHSIDLLFQYSFDPIQVDLSLEKITALLDGLEEKYFPGDWPKMVTVQEMHQELSKQVRLSKGNPKTRAIAIQNFHDSRRNRRRII